MTDINTKLLDRNVTAWFPVNDSHMYKFRLVFPLPLPGFGKGCFTDVDVFRYGWLLVVVCVLSWLKAVVFLPEELNMTNQHIRLIICVGCRGKKLLAGFNVKKLQFIYLFSASGDGSHRVENNLGSAWDRLVLPAAHTHDYSGKSIRLGHPSHCFSSFKGRGMWLVKVTKIN